VTLPHGRGSVFKGVLGGALGLDAQSCNAIPLHDYGDSPMINPIYETALLITGLIAKTAILQELSHAA